MRRIAVLLLLVAVVLLGWLWLRPKAPSGAGTLYFLNWADYIPEELIQKFEAETGAKVVLDTFESPEAMLAKLKAGADQEFSLVVAPDYYVLQMARDGLIAPLDKGKLKNLANLDPFFLDPPYDPGLQYSVPYLWGTTGIAYREDLVTGPVDSYAVFFAPEAQVGPFLLLDEMRETIGAALKYLGYSVNTTDPEALAKAKELLLAAKERSVGFAGGLRALNRILAGDAALSLAYSGDVLQAREEDQRLRYTLAKEGDALDGRHGGAEAGPGPGAGLPLHGLPPGAGKRRGLGGVHPLRHPRGQGHPPPARGDAERPRGLPAGGGAL